MSESVSVGFMGKSFTEKIKFIFSTEQGRWSLMFAISLLLMVSGYPFWAILVGVYSLIFPMSFMADQGVPSSGDDPMKEEIEENMDKALDTLSQIQGEGDEE